MNRWTLYNLLKYPDRFTQAVIKDIEEMDDKELREGVVEYLVIASKNMEEFKGV